MSASNDSKCGPHVELTSNPGARITRCRCGTIHVHLVAQGVSLRLDADGLRHLASALGGAARLVDMTDAAVSVPTGEVVN